MVSVVEQVGRVLGIKVAHEDVANAVHVFELFHSFKDVDGQVSACRTLTELATSKEQNKDFIVEFGGIGIGIDLIANEDRKLQRAGLALLQSLADAEQRRTQIVQDHAMVHLGTILHQQNYSTAIDAARLLASLLQDHIAQQSWTLSEGKVLTALAIMARSSITEAHPHVAESIAFLSENPLLRGPLVKIHVIEGLATMQSGYPVREVVFATTKALHHLTSVQDLVAKCVQHGCIPLLIAGLKHIYPDDIVEMNLKSLTNCRLEVALRRVAMSPNGVDLIVKAMRRSQEGSHSKHNALKMLLFIVRIPDLAPRVLQDGGLEVFLERLQFDGPNNLPQVVRGVKGVARLAAVPDIQELLVRKRPEVVKAALAAGHHVGQIFSEAVSLVINRLTEQSSLHPLMLENFDDFRALVLRYASSDDMATRRNAAKALSRLAQNPATVSFFENPLHMNVLVSCSESHDNEIKRLGSIAVASTMFVAGVTVDLNPRKSLRTLVDFARDAINEKDNYKIHEQAVTALGAFALNEQVEKFFVEEGAVGLIEMFLDSPNANVLHAANVARSNFRGMLRFKHLAKLSIILVRDAIFAISAAEMEDILNVLRSFAANRGLIEGVEDISYAADLCRVGIAIIASGNNDKSNALRFIHKNGLDMVEQYLNFEMRERKELEPWGNDILISITRLVGNVAHNEELAAHFLRFGGIKGKPGCLVRLFTRVLAGCSNALEKESRLIQSSCEALSLLCHGSEKMQVAFVDAGSLTTLILLINQNDDVEVKIGAARALAAIATNEKRSIQAHDAGVMKGVMELILMLKRPSAMHRGITMLSQLCLAENSQSMILKNIEWVDLVRLLRSPDPEIREIVSEFIERVSHNRLHGLHFVEKAVDAGLLPPLLEMVRSKDRIMQRPAIHVLRTLTHFSEVRERLRLLRFPSFFASLARCPDYETRSMAAETVVNMMRVTTPKESLPSKDAMMAILDLVASGDHRYAIEAAERLAGLLKFSDVQEVVCECRGTKILLDLARSVKIEAQRNALLCLYRISHLEEAQEKIAENDGLRLLLNLSEKIADRDDEVEILALRIISNVAINPFSHKVFHATKGAVATLYGISQGNADPNTPEAVVETKKQIAEITLSNMDGPRHVAEIPVLRSKFNEFSSAHMQSLEEALLQYASIPVNRAAANILANKACYETNIHIILVEGGAKVLVDLTRFDDLITQADAARGIGNVSLTIMGRKQLSDLGAMSALCDVVGNKSHREHHPALLLEIITAMANLCQPARDTAEFDPRQNVLHVFKRGMLPFVVQATTSNSADKELAFQAARLVTACNLGENEREDPPGTTGNKTTAETLAARRTSVGHGKHHHNRGEGKHANEKQESGTKHNRGNKQGVGFEGNGKLFDSKIAEHNVGLASATASEAPRPVFSSAENISSSSEEGISSSSEQSSSVSEESSSVSEEGSSVSNESFSDSEEESFTGSEDSSSASEEGSSEYASTSSVEELSSSSESSSASSYSTTENSTSSDDLSQTHSSAQSTT